MDCLDAPVFLAGVSSLVAGPRAGLFRRPFAFFEPWDYNRRLVALTRDAGLAQEA